MGASQVAIHPAPPPQLRSVPAVLGLGVQSAWKHLALTVFGVRLFVRPELHPPNLPISLHLCVDAPPPPSWATSERPLPLATHPLCFLSTHVMSLLFCVIVLLPNNSIPSTDRA